MVESYRSDDEQVEILKKWWEDNGSATLITITLALAGVFGWQTWQQRQADSMNVASVKYQELLDSVASEERLDATQLASVEHLAKELQEENRNSAYAQYAGLLMAKTYVDQGKLKEARAALESVLEQKPNKELLPLVKLRLAKVIFAEGNAEEALKMVSKAERGAFEAAYAELTGDIQQELGDLNAAEAAYEKAKGISTGNQLVELKISGVKTQLSLPDLNKRGAKVAANDKGDDKSEGIANKQKQNSAEEIPEPARKDDVETAE